MTRQNFLLGWLLADTIIIYIHANSKERDNSSFWHDWEEGIKKVSSKSLCKSLLFPRLSVAKAASLRLSYRVSIFFVEKWNALERESKWICDRKTGEEQQAGKNERSTKNGDVMAEALQVLSCMYGKRRDFTSKKIVRWWRKVF